MKSEMNRSSQRGAALIVALLILLVISVIGVSAMRSSSFSAKMAMGTQLDAMAFEGAESAIDQTLTYLLGADGGNGAMDELIRMMNDETIVWCMTGNGYRSEKKCGTSDFMDSRGMIQAETRTTTTGFTPAPGNQVSSTGGGGVIFADFELSIQGNGTLPSVDLQNRHVQNALRRGMIPANEIQ